MTAVDRVLARVAAHGVGPDVSIVDAPLADSAFAKLVECAHAERIMGHLVAAVDSGVLAATDSQRDRARSAHEDALAVDLVLERLLVDTSLDLADAAIAHRALKGAVVAHTSYPDPALRSFGDVDILVDGRHIDAAISRLSLGGGRRRYLEPRPHFTARFSKGVCLVTSDGFELDVHRVFAAGPFGLAIDPSDLFVEPDDVVIGGVNIPALDTTLRFLHACYHASLGGSRPRLSTLRDIVQIAAMERLDRDRASDLARHWRGLAVVQRALALTRATLSVELDGFERIDEYVPSRFEATALDAYSSNRASYAAQAVTGLWAIRGIHARAAYARALLFPTREYVGQREGTYIRRLKRGVALARSWRPLR